MSETRVGKVQAVSGLIDPAVLGHVMMHEHIKHPRFDEAEAYYPVVQREGVGAELAGAPVALENLWWIRYNFDENADNNAVAAPEVWIKELELYRRSGGGTIADVSMRKPRDNAFLLDYSQTTGVNIVTGTGYYTGSSHPPEARIGERAVEDIAAEFVDHILVGDPETGVKAGIIGELGCSWPLTPEERKVLIAGALAQHETGVPITIHPGRNEASLAEARAALIEGGADLSRVVMGHIDRCGYRLSTRRDILDSGMVIEYDVFGLDGWYPAARALADDHMPDGPNDTGRVKQIKELVDLGYADQIVVGHDMHMKFQLATYGGWGYGHYLRNIVPLMDLWGISPNIVRRFSIDTPARLLTIV